MAQAICRLPLAGEHPSHSFRLRWRGAFTLLELMVAISIVTLLVATLIPVVVRARDIARLTQCANNLRQLATAMNCYASQNGGKYPPNIISTAPQTLWCDDDRLGTIIPSRHPEIPSGKAGGGVYVCPNDGPGPVYLSYSMNIWASSKVDASGSVQSQIPTSGRLWSATVKHASQMMLLSEGYSSGGAVYRGVYSTGYIGVSYASTGAPLYAIATTTAAQRFGANGGVLYTAGRFGKPLSELAFYRHRIPTSATLVTTPRGRLNIAYADGHVASKTDADLVLPSGAATGDTYWSMVDCLGN